MALIDKLDTTDLRILKILQEDGCISNLDLSTQVGLSPTPTFERVKKMEKLHIIKGYHADVDSHLLGLGIETFMLVSLAQSKGGTVSSFIKQVNEIDEIVECYRVTGSFDYMFKIIVKDITAYETLAMEKIRKIKEIGQIQTLVILSTIKKSKVVPLPYK
jgi:Lrp/AsnC family transcriptional regulator, leucine-responsive regulatory protein